MHSVRIKTFNLAIGGTNTVKKQRPFKHLLIKSTLLAATVSLLVLPLSRQSFAASEGVYIQNSTYFSLSDVTLSSGADKGSLRFTLDLHNGSGQSIDFNRYGVKIVDSRGVSYTAKLSEKVSARVNPQQVQAFKFISQVPGNVQADQLQVNVFEWSSTAPYSKNIGALSVSAAIDNEHPSTKQVVLNVYELDATLPEDALVAFELGQSYRVLKDGVWNIYTDFYVENLGSTSFKMPSGLSYQFKDNNGLNYAGTMNGGADSLVPKQRVKVTIGAPVSVKADPTLLSLQFMKKTGTLKEVIGSVDLKSSVSANKLGEAAVYPLANQQDVKLSVSWAAVSRQSDGFHVQANITLTNKGTEIVHVPTLTGEFQAAQGTVGLTSLDNAVRPDYLSPQESTTYRYSAILPTGLNTDDLQLAVLEKSSVSSTTGQETAGQTTGQAAAQQSISLPVMVTSLKGMGSGQEATPYASAQSYALGTPFILSSNNLIDSNLVVSLMELHMQENEDLGYKTAIAKYKLTNKGTTNVTLPNFQTDLTSANGNMYTGVRQAKIAETILPSTSSVVSYSFLVPSLETEEKLAMSLYDDNRLGIGSFKVQMQKEAEQGPISFYPFQVDVKDYNLTALYGNSSYTYKLTLFLDITRQDQVIVDPNFSKLTFDLVDALGNVLATESLAFIGDQKVVSGKQNITFSSAKVDQLQTGVTIRMYEQVDTPNGVTKRLVKVLNTP
jgi:hypothetical protein